MDGLFSSIFNIRHIFYFFYRYVELYFPKSENSESPLRILELGCTSGRWLKWFKENFNCETYGIDIVIEGLRLMKQMKHSEPILNDAFNIAFRDESFDIVFALGLVEHFKNPLPILKEAVRVLKVGGKLFISIPNLKRLAPRRFYTFTFSKTSVYDIRPYHLIHMFKQLGLTNIRYRFCGLIFERYYRKFGLLSLANFIKKLNILSDDFIIVGQKKAEEAI